LIILALVLYLLIVYRIQEEKFLKEGFSQREHYIFKQNENKYDDFYAELYDDIQKPEQRNLFEIMVLIKQTMPTEKSNMLDIGCGTGSLVNQLNKMGYRAYGIDKSQEMINMAEKKHHNKNDKNSYNNDFTPLKNSIRTADEFSSKLPVTDLYGAPHRGANSNLHWYKCTDIVDPMLFEPSTFSHILCTNFTIYEFENKTQFFRHCFHWLKSGGYLFVHLVEPDKFDTIAPVGKYNLDKNPQRISKKRITDTKVDFPNYEYKSSYEFGENLALFKETFTDKKTKNIRQNEQQLHFLSVGEIVDIAKKNGFIVHSKADMEECIDDENQFLYIFERIQGNLPLL
jgi:ubiquinone/menaquinone biosynthesis C-methylase UbiE